MLVGVSGKFIVFLFLSLINLQMMATNDDVDVEIELPNRIISFWDFLQFHRFIFKETKIKWNNTNRFESNWIQCSLLYFLSLSNNINLLQHNKETAHGYRENIKHKLRASYKCTVKCRSRKREGKFFIFNSRAQSNLQK